MRRYLLSIMLGTSLVLFAACGTGTDSESTDEGTSSNPSEEVEETSEANAEMAALFAELSAEDFDPTAELVNGCPPISKVAFFSPEEVYDVPEIAFEPKTKNALTRVWSGERENDTITLDLASYIIDDENVGNIWAQERAENDYMTQLVFNAPEGEEITVGSYEKLNSQVVYGETSSYLLSGAHVSGEITYMDEQSVCGHFSGQDQFGGFLKGVFAAYPKDIEA